MTPPLSLLTKCSTGAPLGWVSGCEVDGDLGVQPRAARLADAGSLHALDGLLDRLAVAHPRPADVDLELEVAGHPVLEDLHVELAHARR